MDSKISPAAPTASTLDVKTHQRVRTKSRSRPKHKPGNNNPNAKPAGGNANLEESNSLEVPSLEVPSPTYDNPEGEDAKSTDEGPTNMICFVDPDEQPGLLVTDELDAAIEQCRTKVEQISKDCRARNRKFRFEFPSRPPSNYLTK